eukprot:373593_1
MDKMDFCVKLSPVYSVLATPRSSISGVPVKVKLFEFVIDISDRRREFRITEFEHQTFAITSQIPIRAFPSISYYANGTTLRTRRTYVDWRLSIMFARTSNQQTQNQHAQQSSHHCGCLLEQPHSIRNVIKRNAGNMHAQY